MKKVLFFVLWSLPILIACQKSNEDDCENLILSDPKNQLVGEKELDTIIVLMNNNQIDYSNLQFWQYANMGAIFISAYQYVNGLKVFTDGISFVQKKTETSINIHGDFITTINQTNIHSMSAKGVKDIFLGKIADDEFMKNANIEVGTCVDLEFGYYNLNVYDITLPKIYTKAWRVTPKGKLYPWAYINDQSGDLLEYWNGLCAK